MRPGWIHTAAFFLFLSLASCGQPDDSGGLAGSVKVDGSSTVEPISSAVAEEFRLDSPQVRVTVGSSGTGGGFQKFCANEIDISNASRPIKPTEVEQCAGNNIEFIELPIAYDGLTIVVHPKNNWVDSITTDELKKMWEPAAQDKIVRWNQVRPDWPDKPLHLYGAGVDSGTFDYFTEAIVHEEHASRGDFAPNENDNILVQGISSDESALGFFGIAYYEENKDKLKVLAVDDGNDENGKGPIIPSSATVIDGTYQPLSRPLFIYVNKASLDRPEVAAFLKFYLENGSELVEAVGYIPLPETAYALAQERADSRRTGSLFGGRGSQVGVRIEQLLESEQTDAGK